MMDPARRRVLAVALRCLLGALMLWAAVSKLANPTAFLGSLYGYDLPLPQAVLKLVVVVLPWAELLCGLLLLAGVWLETAFLTTATLLGVFALATGQAAVRGLEISCGCFDLSLLGLNDTTAPAGHWIESPGFAWLRAVALLAATLWMLRGARRDALRPGANGNPLLPHAPQPAKVGVSSNAADSRRRKRR